MVLHFLHDLKLITDFTQHLIRVFGLVGSLSIYLIVFVVLFILGLLFELRLVHMFRLRLMGGPALIAFFLNCKNLHLHHVAQAILNWKPCIHFIMVFYQQTLTLDLLALKLESVGSVNIREEVRNAFLRLGRDQIAYFLKVVSLIKLITLFLVVRTEYFYVNQDSERFSSLGRHKLRWRSQRWWSKHI